MCSTLDHSDKLQLSWRDSTATVPFGNDFQGEINPDMESTCMHINIACCLQY